MKQSRSLTILLPVVLLTLLMVLSTVSIAVAGSHEKTGGTIVQGLETEPTTLDLHDATRRPEHAVLYLIHEPLFIVNRDLEIEPHLAESYEVSDDGLTWTFHLKEGIKFHDGTKLDAEAAKKSFERFKEGSYAWRLEPVEEIVVVDDMTFAFNLSEPFPTMLNHLSNPSTGIISPAAVEKYGEDYGKKAVVGTGPMKFESWKSGEEILLTRYDDYSWGPSYLENQGPAYPDKWKFKIVPETLTLIGELEKGDVDLTSYIPEKELDRLKKNENVNIASLKAPSTAYLAINVQNPPFDELAVRKAIAHAINKDALIKVVLFDNAFPAQSIVPPNVEGYWESGEEMFQEANKFDPEAAKEILEQAGWVDSDGDGVREKDGEELEALTFTYTITRYKRMAEVIRPMLEGIGIKVDLKVLEAGNLYDRVEGGEHDLLVTAWMGVTYAQDFLDPLFNSKNVGTNNFSFFVSDKMDQLISKSKTARSKEARKEALIEAQRMLTEQMPDVALAHYVDMLGYKTILQGVDKFVQHPWALTQAVDYTKPLILYEE